MNNKQRLMLISKVARSMVNEDLPGIVTSQQTMIDKIWIIGMLSDHTLSEDELSKEVERVKKQYPELTDLLRVLKQGDKYIFTDGLGFKQVLIYDGVRKEIKGVEFEVFINATRGGNCFFSDSEVDKMEKVN